MTAQCDGELVERAARGDASALRTLLGRHGPEVGQSLAGNIARQWQAVLDVDDVMQVTYLEAFLQIDRLTARDAASFTRWLRRIAENNLRDAVRELGRRKRPHPGMRVAPPAGEDSHVALLELLGATTTTASRHAARREGANILSSALDDLPADYRTAVRLYDLEGRSIVDVASAMDRSVGAVHMLRARAHDRLKAMLGSPARFFSDPA